MFVLSVEGPGHLDRYLWRTHKILGVFETKEAALESDTLEGMTDEDIVILTNTETGDAVSVRCTSDDEDEEDEIA